MNKKPTVEQRILDAHVEGYNQGQAATESRLANNYRAQREQARLQLLQQVVAFTEAQSRLSSRLGYMLDKALEITK